MQIKFNSFERTVKKPLTVLKFTIKIPFQKYLEKLRFSHGFCPKSEKKTWKILFNNDRPFKRGVFYFNKIMIKVQIKIKLHVFKRRVSASFFGFKIHIGCPLLVISSKLIKCIQLVSSFEYCLLSFFNFFFINSKF